MAKGRAASTLAPSASCTARRETNLHHDDKAARLRPARDSIRSEADIEAERLEQEAEAARKAADRRAEAVKGEVAK